MLKKQEEGQASNGEQKFSVQAPSISLPKGGGAIRGIGEKFAANPVTGTGSMSVPIATSPGRAGFGPQLSLSYDSGSGNGPFGFGWSLSLPAITRKTDKGLPQYRDAEESDVFLLSGAEDLVLVYRQDVDGSWVADHPTYERDADGFWVRDPAGRLLVHEDERDGYCVRRYRPRIEGLFARIERWTKLDDATDVHWRSISKENILTLYGKDDKSRITDPKDPGRIFSWLICESRDDRGNALIYEYRKEDGEGVDLAKSYEHNRGDREDRRRTANRYLKRIRYGNRTPLLDDLGRRLKWLEDAQIQTTHWMFEVVFDYEDHNPDVPNPRDNEERDASGRYRLPWSYRQDPFSSYRAGFEVRTTRLCQRVLMFHHFPDEAGVGSDCLVRSTDFTYSHEADPTNTRNPVYTFLRAVTQSGYKRENGGYLKRSFPPVEFEYTQPVVQDTVEEVDPGSLENLPTGAGDAVYQWIDLHGDGIPGILSEQAGGWFYKRNLSPIGEGLVELGPLERIPTKPNLAISGGQGQFMDLAGDGQPDLVVLDGPLPGLYEHDGGQSWQPFRSFSAQLQRDLRDPNLKIVDLDGDGHADVLISEEDAFVWHASLAEAGFGLARRVHKALDEEHGPRLVFADGEGAVYLSDMSGDGLSDLVRIRNGEVCYWPNMGYGRFGAKVTMENAPWFDSHDQFDQGRIRLADIDGSGTTDLIYLHGDGVTLYFNQSGNGWGAPQTLAVTPHVDSLAAISTSDLLGNGTACLVWSSPLPGDARRPMHYVNLMGGAKPHLLVKIANNLGAETRVDYAPSTKFYLQDRRDGKPWITRLPFPVHVVERVETYDYINRNRFVTRYAYHHGYFDGEEREFRGFGLVEQWDTEELGTLDENQEVPSGANWYAASYVPPVLTRSWFHTGAYIDRQHISDFFAGLLDGRDVGEYYREPGLDDPEARALLLDDTPLPADLTLEEERQACRALKSSLLRQEVYALDGTEEQEHPYTVAEANFAIRRLQPMAGNRHAVFSTHARETINYHYERNPADPRVAHTLTLEVDDFGDVLKSAEVGYGRRRDIRVVDEGGEVSEVPNPALDQLERRDRDKQIQVLVTYTENSFTKPVDEAGEIGDSYRTPLPCETRTYELTGYTATGPSGRFGFSDFVEPADGGLTLRFDGEIGYEESPTTGRQRRLIEQLRTLYRRDDLSGPLPLGDLQPLALPYESYKMAFTPELLAGVYQRAGEDLLPDPSAVLGARGSEGGGYVDLDGDGRWWIASGQVFYSPDSDDPPPQELAHARAHFFLPCRYRDPFHTEAFRTESFVTYDDYDLLVLETRDALDNRVTVGERDGAGSLTLKGNDYRVLAPRLAMDPNRNRSVVAYDVLGLVVGTAVMGKPEETLGDSMDDFEPDLSQDQIDEFYEDTDPHDPAVDLLQGASTRIIYDLHHFHDTRREYPDDPARWLPAFAATLSRETHTSDPLPADGMKIQISFSYSDGFGREIQKKIQAEPGPIPLRDPADGSILVVDGQPLIGTDEVSPRWVGSGWMVFNNKGKPVRQYEPFFTDLHRFEFDARLGVSPVLFYDSIGRAVATLRPDHTWEKVVFDPWQQATFDASDTVLNADGSTDPRLDPDVAEFFNRLPEEEYLPIWYEQRQTLPVTDPERIAADKAAVHRLTPTVAHLDSLGRLFLSVEHNRFQRRSEDPIVEEFYATRVDLDIEGNQRQVIDALDRLVMRYDYDMLGNRIHQASMEAGERWTLNDVTGKPIRLWDSRGFMRRLAYDALRRPTDLFVGTLGSVRLAEHTDYGEAQGSSTNHRGKIYQVKDAAGVVTMEAYDFKGNLLRSRRMLLSNYRDQPDWSGSVGFEDEVFNASTRYDALNRPVQLVAPYSNRAGSAVPVRLNVIRPGYNEAGLLERVDLWLELRSEPTGLLDPDVTAPSPHGVADIDYDAKGQRTHIEYKNQGVTTTYTYDRQTFRLVSLLTSRPPSPNGLASQLFSNPATVQDLHYTYDPVGNITHIHDRAVLSITFNNEQVEPVSRYIYDAINRLIFAEGREHIGQTAFDFHPPEGNYRDYPFIGRRAHPNDPQAVRNFTETYVYDEVGNFVTMAHGAAGGSWTRGYTNNEPSLLEAGRYSNRLTSTQVSGEVETYSYRDAAGVDVHGCMTAINTMQSSWDFKDQLQKADLGGGGMAYYAYDTSGQRVRKVIERLNGTPQKERLYLGGFEIYREYNGVVGEAELERETLHLMDDQQRIALIETRIVGNEPGVPRQVVRYQLGNHLGSASLELDPLAQVISYEEYTPYGSTSFQAVRSQVETPKRYRYTGMERDEESGLNYHTARYYAPWLGRWTSPDPMKAKYPQYCSYNYCFNNPIFFSDSAGKDPPEDRSRRQSQGTIDDIPEGQRTATTDAGQTRRVRASTRSRLRSATMSLAMGIDIARGLLGMAPPSPETPPHSTPAIDDDLPPPPPIGEHGEWDERDPTPEPVEPGRRLRERAERTQRARRQVRAQEMARSRSSSGQGMGAGERRDLSVATRTRGPVPQGDWTSPGPGQLQGTPRTPPSGGRPSPPPGPPPPEVTPPSGQTGSGSRGARVTGGVLLGAGVGLAVLSGRNERERAENLALMAVESALTAAAPILSGPVTVIGATGDTYTPPPLETRIQQQEVNIEIFRLEQSARRIQIEHEREMRRIEDANYRLGWALERAGIL